ncbi:MAG: hypothetical protein JO131_05895 [Gammaproteobacteria bacterium]|nr:hypothetical protein [Gammaproteobacteria bacterium]
MIKCELTMLRSPNINLTSFHQNYETLAIDMLNLANYYCSKNHRSYIKSAGLINFVINLLEQLNSKKYSGIIAILNKCVILNLEQYLLCKSAVNFDILKINFKLNLKKIRTTLFTEFIGSNQNRALFPNLHKKTQKKMDHFFQTIITSGVAALGIPPCLFSIAYLGSNARNQATHSSDVEFFIVVSHSNVTTHKYFQDLTQLILLLIVNIGETILPALNIPQLSSVYDDITPRGYSLDANLTQACKTPLGAKSFGKSLYRLIGTPDELAEFATLKWYNHDRYFPQLLCLSRYIYGDKNLYTTFVNTLKKTCNKSYISYGLALFSYDIEKYTEILESSFEVVTHKKYYFRPINALIDDLYILAGFVNNQIGKLSILQRMNYISYQTFTQLNQILNHILFLRHYRHNSYRLIKSFPLPQQKPFLDLANIKLGAIKKSNNILLNQFSFFKEKIVEDHTRHLIDENKLYNEVVKGNKKLRSRL